MTKSVAVLAVPHQLQNPKTLGYIKDPSYSNLIKSFINKGVDFVFEEASGLGPTTAQSLAESLLGQGHYMDIDPAPSDRAQYGIAKITGGRRYFDPSGFASDRPDSYEFANVEEQKKREELWSKRIADQPFEKGLAICGVCHGLSLAFNLQKAGVSVSDAGSYIPYHKMH
jgi:hypothetical protein